MKGREQKGGVCISISPYIDRNMTFLNIIIVNAREGSILKIRKRHVYLIF